MDRIVIIGAGLAGCEAAWQAAEKGHDVDLYEMRPEKTTPAHTTGLFAEMVCSNSMRSNALSNAVGILKEEMRRLGSVIIKTADENSVPAGSALAVDREKFSASVTDKISSHPKINIMRKEVTEIPSGGIVIIATGPLTSDALTEAVLELTGESYLYFHDAIAPVIKASSLDHCIVFRASRYEKGEGEDYLNCPMTEEEYNSFWSELILADKAPLKDFETSRFFEGCLPLEEMARRGRDTLAFGPLKPVGLIDPRTGRQPYGIVQLRQEDIAAENYNLVGFQTNLKFSEQERVFRMIPGMKNAEFVRHGVMHRNTYINAPALLMPSFRLKKEQRIFFAGQISGVEGYVESAASGLIAGRSAFLASANRPVLVPPPVTCMGALCRYISCASPINFQPIKINFGIVKPLGIKERDKRKKNLMLAERALSAIEAWKQNLESLQ